LIHLGHRGGQFRREIHRFRKPKGGELRFGGTNLAVDLRPRGGDLRPWVGFHLQGGLYRPAQRAERDQCLQQGAIDLGHREDTVGGAQRVDRVQSLHAATRQQGEQRHNEEAGEQPDDGTASSHAVLLVSGSCGPPHAANVGSRK
jgi:hypothetical protein